MSTVVQFSRNTKQHRGGFIKPSSMTAEVLGEPVSDIKENISPAIIGLVVDYMTRAYLVNNIERAFGISLKGAEIAEQYGVKNAKRKAKKLLSQIKRLDSKSIRAACGLVAYDVYFRNIFEAMEYGYIYNEPDEDTCKNIASMITNSIKFIRGLKSKVTTDFTFEGGYTDIVDSGDGDYLTSDAIWDFKVSRKAPDSKQTLQILTYYLLGRHSGQSRYENISYIGLYNPRSNTAYKVAIKDIPEETIRTVEELMGY